MKLSYFKAKQTLIILLAIILYCINNVNLVKYTSNSLHKYLSNIPKNDETCNLYKKNLNLVLKTNTFYVVVSNFNDSNTINIIKRKSKRLGITTFILNINNFKFLIAKHNLITHKMYPFSINISVRFYIKDKKFELLIENEESKYGINNLYRYEPFIAILDKKSKFLEDINNLNLSSENSFIRGKNNDLPMSLVLRSFNEHVQLALNHYIRDFGIQISTFKNCF